MTKQNAANAEESPSASEELSAQAEQLKSTVLDLVALVGGTAAGGDAGPQPDRPTSPRQATAPPARRAALSPDLAFERGAAAQKAPGAKAAVETDGNGHGEQPKPEDVLHLDESEELSRF